MSHVERHSITQFLSSPAFGVVGVSADRKKFGNIIYRSMKERGLTVYPVHPTHTEVEGDHVYGSVLGLPEAVQSIITVVRPDVTEDVLLDCVRKGIQHVWMQQGSESRAAVELAERSGITVIDGQCILMFLEPVKSIHAFHRWVSRLIRSYPA